MEKQRKLLGKWTRLGAVAAAALLLTGCARTVYLPAETAAVRVDSDSLTRLVSRFVERSSSARERETLYVFRDREVTLNDNGDTVRVNTNTLTDRSRELETENRLLKSENDSLRRATARTDSVYVERPYPVEVVREVERTRSWWETALLWAGSLSLIASGIFLVRKYKK